MVHHRQSLPLGLEPGDDLPGVHAGLDDLQRHPAADRFLLLGHVDRRRSRLRRSPVATCRARAEVPGRSATGGPSTVRSRGSSLAKNSRLGDALSAGPRCVPSVLVGPGRLAAGTRSGQPRLAVPMLGKREADFRFTICHWIDSPRGPLYYNAPFVRKGATISGNFSPKTQTPLDGYPPELADRAAPRADSTVGTGHSRRAEQAVISPRLRRDPLTVNSRTTRRLGSPGKPGLARLRAGETLNSFSLAA